MAAAWSMDRGAPWLLGELGPGAGERLVLPLTWASSGVLEAVENQNGERWDWALKVGVSLGVRGEITGSWSPASCSSHLPGSPIVKIFCPRQVPYTKRSVLPVGFQRCVTLNLFLELEKRYFTLKCFKY